MLHPSAHSSRTGKSNTNLVAREPFEIPALKTWRMLFVIRRNTGVSRGIPNWWRSDLRCIMMNTDLVLTDSSIDSGYFQFATSVFGEWMQEFSDRFGPESM